MPGQRYTFLIELSFWNEKYPPLHTIFFSIDWLAIFSFRVLTISRYVVG